MAATRTLIFLGTGTSVGVPMLGCECVVCRSPNPKNHRYRSSVLFRLPGGNVLVDTGPELRLQLLRENVGLVHAVLFTHFHADHIAGLDDLRPLCKYLGGPIPLHCDAETEGKIRAAFSYAFGPGAEQLPAGMIPKLVFRRIGREPFEVAGTTVTPIPLVHSHFDVLGFRVGDLAYCTDVNEIPRPSWPHLEGLDTLIVDALRPAPHVAHFGLAQALDVIAQFKPRRAFLTHMSHELDYETVNPTLPPGVQMAYDGLRVEF